MPRQFFPCLIGCLLLALCRIIPTNAEETIPPTTSPLPAPTFQKDINEFLRHSTLAGVIRRSAKVLTVTPEKTKLIRDGLKEVVNLDELVFLFVVGWLVYPALKFQYDVLGLGDKSPRHRNFRDTGLHLVFDNLGQLSKLAFVVYIVDMLKVIIKGMGYHSIYGGNIPHAFAKICYTAWIANRIAALKRYTLARHTRQISNYPELKGQVQIVDRLADAAIYALGLYVVVDTVQNDFGVVSKGFLAFGGVSTLVVSLAMQGFVAELLHGLFLAGSSRIFEGDSVELLGMKGKIERLGWLESTLRRSDDIMVSIPNKDLAGQKIANLSRVRLSQVKQTLRFKYDNDAFEKIPALLEDIRQEISAACPLLIRDGSRPLRLHMTNFAGDHIEVVVNCHFRIKPVGTNYWDNRQQVLLAIGRAVKKSKLEFQMVM